MLPGFHPDSKIRMLSQLKDQVEIVVAVSAVDLEKSKVRGDLGITYGTDTLRLIDAFRSFGFQVGSVVLTRFSGQPAAEIFQAQLEGLGLRVYRHYPIEGYPYDIPLIVSEEGYGKNEYVETSRSLVVVTAPGPGSGKMAVCLSQLYHEYKRGVQGGVRQVRDLPHLEPPPAPPGEPGLRGGHRRPQRREHDRPLPPGGLRGDHGELQPGCGDLPGAQDHV